MNEKNMEKRKLKPVTVNFLLVLIIVMGFFALACIVSNYISSLVNEFNIFDTDTGGFSLGKFVVLLLSIIKWLYIIYGAILLFFSGIAAIVHGPSQGRILAYRILMGITYFFIVYLILALISVFFTNDLYESLTNNLSAFHLNFYFIYGIFIFIDNISVYGVESNLTYVIFAVIEIVLFLILFFNIRNTYSWRICPESASLSGQERFRNVNRVDSSGQNEE